MNIFFVNSAFQLIILNKLLIERSIKSGILVIKKNKSDNYQLSYEIEKIKESRKIKVIYAPNSLLLFNLFSLITFFCQKIFIGDIKSIYYHSAIRFTNSKKIFFFDDGFSSLLILDLLKNGLPIPILNGGANLSTKKKLAFEILNIKYKEVPIDSFTFYSIFADSSFNNVEKITILDNENFLPLNSSSVFLGGKYVDIKILNFESYCNAIIKAYNIADGDLVYIPHRAESKEFLDKLKKQIPYIVITVIDKPIELYLIENQWAPKFVFSIYSTALFTLANLFPTSNVYFKSINIELIPNQYQKSLRSLYHFLTTSQRFISY
ncbi:hypothetical protein ABN063_19290 [Providencia vermicola]|uniref:hypothetical protein n=1 Tax=Providencia vermicola TaxID=333965 RepID=UPI0032DAE66B